MRLPEEMALLGERVPRVSAALQGHTGLLVWQASRESSKGKEGFQPTDCTRRLQTRMLRLFQVSVGRDGLCCAGWEVQRVLGRLSNNGNLSSPSEISLWDLQAKQAAEVSAGMKNHLLPRHFLQATHLGRGLIKKSSAKELPTPVITEAAKVKDPAEIWGEKS